MPANPKIYHIVHWDRLPSITVNGGLLCDAVIANDPPAGTTIGMTSIKRRRILKPVHCHWGTKVADYVPFYFCPRSVMLNVIHNKNSNPNKDASLSYMGGQTPVVHLESDLHEVIDWANSDQRRWAFSTMNAAANKAQFYSELTKLSEINWDAVETNSWNRPEIKAAKQAEFLIYGYFPWYLVSSIGVIDCQILRRVIDIVGDHYHQPAITVERDWYY